VLVQAEEEVCRKPLSVKLFLVQAKYTGSFAETPVLKFQRFIKDLLEYNTPIDTYLHLNHRAREAMAIFRAAYESVMATAPGLEVEVFYVTKADQSPNPKVERLVSELKQFVQEQITDSKTTFGFWGARTLLQSARTTPKSEELIPIGQRFNCDDKSAVCLVKLSDFAHFITDDQGNIRRRILEPNVRDYQGYSNPVNVDIRKSLMEAQDGEFWWLNNGITILVTKCELSGGSLKIETPEIVNGLQTCHEIFNYFKHNPGKDDARHVLIRAIPPPNERVRSGIIKATNNQTSVDAISLKANDPIHFDIEDRFKLYSLYYDRRKGEHRARNRPISKIISVRALAQAVMAILLQRPDDARARPTTALKRKETYPKIFGEDYNIDLYVVCIQIDRKVKEYLKSRKEEIDDQVRVNIHYYVDMGVASLLLKKSGLPPVDELAALLPITKNSIPQDILGRAYALALDTYNGLGGDDKAAKGSEMKNRLLKEINAELQPAGDLLL